MKLRGPRRFLTRVFLGGLVLLTATTLALVVVGHLVFAPAFQERFTGFATWVASRVDASLDDREALRAEVAGLGHGLRARLAVYDRAGTLLAAAGDPTLVPATADELARLSAAPHVIDGDEPLAAVRRGGEVVAYVRLAFPSQLSAWRAALLLCAVLAVLVLASIPLARSVAKPVERLRGVAKAFGEGDLAARANLEREDEIGDLARAIDLMAERVTTLLRSEKELLANVSHELRTPLARIRVVLELAGEVDADRSRRYLGEIADDLGELERLIDEVLETARLDLAEGRAAESEPRLHLEEIDAARLVERVARRARERSAGRVIEVVASGEVPVVRADPAMLRRALDNLVDNALKYSDPERPVAVRVEGEGERVVFEVQDHGIGIAERDLEKVFTPFFRTDRSRSRGTGGFGLGLPLARRIARAHGGDLVLRSAPERGTVARMWLPRSAGGEAHLERS